MDKNLGFTWSTCSIFLANAFPSRGTEVRTSTSGVGKDHSQCQPEGIYRYQSPWWQGERNPVLLQFSLHSSFLVVISQAQLLLDLLLGTMQHNHIGDFIWNWRENMVLVHFTPSWIKDWMNFLSSPAVVPGNVVLFLVMLHWSCSEEMLWLTRSSSLGACSRNIPAKCLATESLLPSTNNWLLAR